MAGEGEPMARIRLVTEATATHAEREALIELRKRRPGPLINIHAAILNAPSVMGPFIALADALRHETELDPGLRELAILVTTATTASRYEFLRHWKLALDAGVPNEKLRALSSWESDAHFSDLERAVLELAREATASVKPTDETWSSVHGMLGHRQTVELLLTIGLYNLTARLTEPVALEDEPHFTPMPGALETFAKIQGAHP